MDHVELIEAAGQAGELKKKLYLVVGKSKSPIVANQWYPLPGSAEFLCRFRKRTFINDSWKNARLIEKDWSLLGGPTYQYYSLGSVLLRHSDGKNKRVRTETGIWMCPQVDLRYVLTPDGVTKEVIHVRYS